MARIGWASDPLRSRWITVLLPVVIFCLVGGIDSYLLGQDMNFDARNYHFYNPWALLHGQIDDDIAPASIQSYLNPLADFLPYFLFSVAPPVVAGVALGAVHGLNGWLAYLLAAELFAGLVDKRTTRELLCLAAGLLSFLGSASVSEVGATFGDNLVSLPTLAGVLLVVRGTRVDSRRLVLAGFVMSGVAAGAKLTSAGYVVALLVACVVVGVGGLHWRARLGSAVANAVAAAVGLAAAGGWWYVYLSVKFASPVYPFYNGIFGAEGFPAINFTDGRFLPEGLAQSLFYPFYFLRANQLVSEPYMREWRLAAVYVALVILAVVCLMRVARRRPALVKLRRDHMVVVVFLVVGYVLWQELFSIYRYALALEVLALVVLMCVAFEVIPARFGTAAIPALLAAVVVACGTIPMEFGRVPWQPTVFGTDIPGAASMTDAVVLLGGVQPLAYVALSLPQSAQVVWVDDRNVMLRPDGRLNAPFLTSVRHRVDRALAESRPVFWLTTSLADSETELSYFDLAYDRATCLEGASNVGLLNSQLGHLRLCRLTRDGG